MLGDQPHDEVDDALLVEVAAARAPVFAAVVMPTSCPASVVVPIAVPVAIATTIAIASATARASGAASGGRSGPLLRHALARQALERLDTRENLVRSISRVAHEASVGSSVAETASREVTTARPGGGCAGGADVEH